MSTERIDDEFIAAVEGRLRAGQRVRRLLPSGGRMHIDRLVPYLCVHRTENALDAPSAALVSTQASHLIAGLDDPDPRLGELVARVGRILADRLGSFLLVEVWEREPSSPMPVMELTATDRPLRFRLSAPTRDGVSLVALERGMRGRVDETEDDDEILAETTSTDSPTPPDLEPLLSVSDLDHDRGLAAVGIAVDPVYRRDGIEYPAMRSDVVRRFGERLRHGLWEFTDETTDLGLPHPLALGRRTLGGAAWNVDRRIEEVDNAFDFLWLVTPLNTNRAWERFRRGGYRSDPAFDYRPLPFDPELLKRRLFDIPIERVEDPIVLPLFREKQEELDQQITMLRTRGDERFLFGSLALYGRVEEELLDTAESLLARLPADAEPPRRTRRIDAEAFVPRARLEIERYRERYRAFDATVETCTDLASHLLVSRDRLLVDRDTAIAEERVEALLHHEIGTHLVTYFNGRAQRLRQFSCGLAGYEALQEGLAVLAEYLCDGLTAGRLRTLAARVVACDDLVRGASFVDAFRRLVDAHGFEPAAAFRIVTRVYRGGGLTKDAVYLRGLEEAIAFLNGGGDVRRLLVGKIATRHLPFIDDLIHRNFFRPPPVMPLYLELEVARERIAGLAEGDGLERLVETARP